MATGYKIDVQDGLYYLTLQIVEWVDLFTRKIYRDIVIESLNYCQHHKGLEIYAYVIMSNHIHLLVRSNTTKLSETIRDFKSYTAKQFLTAIDSEQESRRKWMIKLFEYVAKQHKRNFKHQVWTHENHAEIILSNKFLKQKIDYIHNNPVKAGIVCNPKDYLYSSASYFHGECGLIQIKPLIYTD